MGAQSSKTSQDGTLQNYNAADEVYFGPNEGHNDKAEIHPKNDLSGEVFDEITNYYHDDHGDVVFDEYRDWVVIQVEVVGQLLNEELAYLQHNTQVPSSPNRAPVRCVSFSDINTFYEPNEDNNFHQSTNDQSKQYESGWKNDVARNSLSTIDDNFDGDFIKPSIASSMESFTSCVSSSSEISCISTLCEDLAPTRIQTFLKYNTKNWVLTVGVKQAECSLHKKYRNRQVYWQVQMTLLPLRLQRRKTKYKSTLTPIFNQTFDIQDVPKPSLTQMAIRYRLYRRFRKVGRKKMVGEVEVGLGELSGRNKTTKTIDGEWWTLVPIVHSS